MSTDRAATKSAKQQGITGEAGRLSPELHELLHMLQSLESQFGPRSWQENTKLG